jgi:hypothetical protein
MTDPAARLAPPPGRPHSRAHLQALDDAIAYRAARLRAPCRTCRPGAPCHAHGRDLSLLETYHEIARAAVAVLNAAKCLDGKDDSAAIPQEPAAASRNPANRREQGQPA